MNHFFRMAHCFSPMPRFRTDWILPCGILAAALLLRLYEYNRIPFLSRDSYLYIQLAENWFRSGTISSTLESNGTVNWIPPLAQYLMMLPMYLGIPSYYSGTVTNMLAGLGLVWLVWLLADTISPALLFRATAMALAAIHPALVDYSIQVQRESLYLFFGALFMLSACRFAQTEEPKWSLCGGGAFAAATLIRYEAFELLLLTGLWFSWAVLFRRERCRKYSIALGLFLVAAAIFYLLSSVMMDVGWSYYKVYLQRFGWGD